MGKHLHRVLGFDAEESTLQCLTCGTVTLAYNYQGRPMCSEARRANVEKHNKGLGHMVNSARSRAKRRGLEFSLTKDDLTIPEYCPILGIKLTFDGPGKEHSPSLDRIDNSGGYTLDNVQVISWRANRIKSDATKEELLAIAATM